MAIREADRRGWTRYLKASAVVVLITLAGLQLEMRLAPSNVAMLYLLGVVFTSIKWGLWPALMCSLIGIFLFDFLFIQPYRSFAFTDVWYLITLITFICVAALVSILSSNAREQALAAREREAQTALLYALTRSLGVARHTEEVLQIAAGLVRQAFGCDIALLLADEVGALVPRFVPGGVHLSASIYEDARRVYEQSIDDISPNQRVAFIPLKTASRAIGVMVLLQSSHSGFLPGRERVMDAVATQVALAIEHNILEENARDAEILRRADELHRTLLNSVSHSLRAPLAAILSAVNPIAEAQATADPATVLELARVAQGEAFRLDTLIGNLLDLSRLEAGALKFRQEPHDIEDVIGAALQEFQNPQERPIEIAVRSGLPLVSIDFVLLVNVLVNLLDNAIKYSPGGEPVKIEAALRNGRMEVRVSDHGCGIPPNERGAIFGKFARGSGTEHTPGLGLGLPICKGFIEAHHGRIWVEEGTGGGSVFCFTLPICDSKMGPPTRAGDT